MFGAFNRNLNTHRNKFYFLSAGDHQHGGKSRSQHVLVFYKTFYCPFVTMRTSKKNKKIGKIFFL